MNQDFFWPHEIARAAGKGDWGPKKVEIHGHNLSSNKKVTPQKNNVPNFLKQQQIGNFMSFFNNAKNVDF